RAEILENFYHDYDSALVIYKNASANSTPEEYRFLAQKKSNLLNKYITYHETIKDLDTQKIYILFPEEFIEDSLEYVQKVKLDSIKNAESDQTVSRQRGSRTTSKKSQFKKPLRPKIGVDSLNALYSKNYFELANLLFSEFDDPDSAYYYYNLSLDAKKENPNEAQTYFALGNYFLIKEEKETADSMFTIVYDKFEFDPIRNEAAKILGKPLYDFDKDPVEEEFLKAEEIYESRKYDSAIDKLYSIYENNPKSIYASKSLYTIGFILEYNLDMPDSAAAVYGILNKEYRTSEYARAIQAKYNGYKREQAELAAKQDSIQNANNEINEDNSKSPNTTELTGDSDSSGEDKGTDTDTDAQSDIPPSAALIPPEISTEVETIIVADATTDSSDKEIQPLPEKTLEKKTPALDSKKDKLVAVSRDIFRMGGKYYVQVSSWKTKNIAEDELKKLNDNGYNAFISEVYVKELESLYHRIRVGPYNSIDEAKSVRMKFHSY
ncbi:MAG: SPOR domain-containing protein, partial [Melioribacteraceae bacterium]|nr:SPOR domain-containing protein [Melioribacteraceae bacterium]